MKKLILATLIALAIFIPVVALLPSSALAQVTIDIGTPDQGIKPNARVSDVITNIITIIFVFAAIAVLVMLIIGAFQWITSGGEKEAVGKARGRIVNAIIGLVVLALAFLIVNVVGGIVNVNILNNLTLPKLDTTANGVGGDAD